MNSNLALSLSSDYYFQDKDVFFEHFCWKSTVKRGWLEGEDADLACQCKDRKDESLEVFGNPYALYEKQFVGINKYRYNVMHVDVDTVNNESYYMPWRDKIHFDQLGVPLPNVTVPTPRGGFHAFWFLERGIPKKCASFGSIRYFGEVRLKLVKALGGDSSCNITGAVRSPFNDRAHVFHDSTFHLGDLNIPVKLDAKASLRHLAEYTPGNRNHATFSHALRIYKHAPEITVDALLSNIEQFQSLADADSLTRAENMGIAKSVLRNGCRYSVRADRNYGAAQLPVMDYSRMTTEERCSAIRERQHLGQLYTATSRKAKTKLRLYAVVDEMERGHFPITLAAIVRESGLAKNTVKKYLTVSDSRVVWQCERVT